MPLRIPRLIIAVLLAATLVALLPPPHASAVTPIYFPQTGHALGAHFTLAWRERGGVALLGYPLSEEFVEDGRITQYFERAVLHYFPEYARTPYAVQGRQLGRDLTQGRDGEAAFAPVGGATGGRDYFAATGHTLGGPFGRAWRDGGGLLVFGYPLSEEFVEVNAADGQPYLTQYFERARFEYHPAAAGTSGEVTFGLLGNQRAATLGLFASTPFAPIAAPPAAARTITRFATSEPVIVLTFDAGADRGYTAEILDTLAAKGVRASFGLTGLWSQAHPDLVARIGAEGHHVINHTYDHRSFTGLSDGRGGLTPEQRVAEVEQTDTILAPLLGRSSRPWFRPPYGEYDEAALSQLAAAGYSYNLLWTIDTQGWNGASVQAILDRTFSGAVPGAIVLLHVGSDSRDGPALAGMIDGLRARGYRFATAAEMVE
jgi:peptidoglycan/xylan/chitin deacetylase (PgdA/CDA1 family)